ncbi:hypothetical protein B9N43_09205 [Denitratisoma sp. DHT3]|uniref:flavin reductase n=1 Tax=Denitratisoma sp. DHT3 TaxID=1981880 RepID=UPI0011982E8F|nr:flavin reductase [Denitratisoma sp. DHT3]QDX81406.1 hypothetical protein B9N43_09205 [Denitratisoma sp. DHT3]
MSRPTIDARDFRTALGSFATGVTVITTRAADGTPVGLTANSFNSVSLEPPMVLWSLARTAKSMPVFEQAQHFAVHVLAADQADLSVRFARSGGDKFAHVALESGIAGLPLLPGCAARFQCKTSFRHDGGDHLIFVGEVLEFDCNQRAPLIYHAGQYALSARRGEMDEPRSARMAGSFGEDHLGYLLSRASHHFYQPVRRQVHALGLSDDAYSLLSLLTLRQTMSHQDAMALLGQGANATAALLADIGDMGLVARDEAGEPRYRLTDKGRDVTLHLMAASKARESEVLSVLGEVDAFALKTLLLRLVREHSADQPDLWAEPDTAE